MAGYIFEHNGKQFTPEGVVSVPSTAEHNAQLEAAELERWKTRPDRQLGYYTFPIDGRHVYTEIQNSRYYGLAPACAYCSKAPGDHAPIEQDQPNRYRSSYEPRRTDAIISTWNGTVIGRITSAHVYPHNFGGRFVALTMTGINGVSYYGRASWDNGSCINLRKVKG